MEEQSLPPGRTVSPSATPDSLDDTSANAPVSSYAAATKQYPIETLEVHTEGARGPAAAVPTALSLPFSRRRATIVSLVITLIVLLISAISTTFLIKQGTPDTSSSQLNVPQQDVSVEEATGSLPELEGAENALLVNGDVIARGALKVVSGDFTSTLQTADLTSNQVFTLPNASGTFCLDVNNCNFATQDQIAGEAAQLAQQAAALTALQTQLNQIVIPPAGVTSLNDQAGAVSIQGTSNQINVTTSNGTITLSTPQDLATISSPTFAGLLLNGNLNVTGTVTLVLNCTGFANNGKLTTDASGQIICGDDVGGGGGGAPNNADYLVVNLDGSLTNDRAFAAGTNLTAADGGANGNYTLSVVGNPTFSGLVTANGLNAGAGLIQGTGGLTVGGTITFSSLTNGFLEVNGSGVVSVGTINLGTDTVGDYVANLGTLTGLSVTGNTGEGSTPNLSVIYGAGANQAVQGNTNLVCASGVGNLSGGGNSVTLGAGGSCNNISIVNNPTFSTSVTTPSLILTGAGNSGTLQVANLGQATTYTLPDPGQATATICLSTGNCAGSGGGVTTAGGTAGRLSVFTGAQTIADSWFLQNSSTLELDATRNLSLLGGNLSVTGTINGTGVITSDTSLRVLESTGATFFGVFDVGDLSADQTYTFLQGGTVVTSGNVSSFATTGVTAGGGLTGGGTTGVLTLDIGAGNGVQVNANDVAVIYGSTANTAVQGNTQITVNAGTNLTGGGTLTLGTGGPLTVNVADSPTFAGNVTIQGGTVTVGTALQQGVMILHDGSSNTGTVQLAALGQNTVYTLPDPGQASVSICLTTGNCAGAGGGITGSGTINRVAKFTGAGTIGDSTITDDGTNVSITGDFTLQGGDITVGTSSQLGSLILHDGNGQTTTLRGGDSTGNLTFILPGSTGTTNQCIKQSGTPNQLFFDNCDGGAGGSSTTLQQAYNNGNTINTTTGRDIAFTLSNDATDSNFVVTIADDSTSTVQIVRVNGTGTNNPAQLLMLENQDGSEAIADGLRIQSAGGGITDAIDLSDAELVNALNVGDNTITGTTAIIDFTNFDVLGNGNTSIGGTLAVTGAVTGGTYNGQTISSTASFTGTLNVAGVTTLQSTLAVQGASATIGGAAQQGSLILNDGSLNTGTIQTTALGQNTTYTLPDPGQATANICLSTGNCIGSGGGAPNNAEYLLVALNGTLTNERALAAGSNIAFTDAGANGNFTVATVQNPTFTTSVTTPLLQSTGALQIDSAGTLDITAGNAITVGSTGETLTLRGSVTTITSNGVGNDIVLNSADTIELQDNTNITGTLIVTGATTLQSTLAVQGGSVAIGGAAQQGSLILNDGNGQTATISVGSALVANTALAIPTSVGASDTICLQTLANCAGSGGGVTTAGGTTNRMAVFTGAQTIGDSWFLQNGSTLELDNTRNLSLLGGNLSVTGNGSLTGNLQVDGNTTLGNASTDTLTVNATTTFTTDIDAILADTENITIGSTVTGTNSVSVLNGVITNNTSSGTQNLVLLQNAAGTGTTEALLALDNVDTDTAVAGGLVITSAAGGITTAIDVSDADIVNALLFGANDIIGTNFTVAGSTGAVTSGSSLQQGSLILHDGNGQTATISVGSALAANTALAVPTGVGASDTFCMQTLGNCFGSGTGNTLQAAYDAGNTITTTNNRNIAFTLDDTATDASFITNIASGSTGRFAVQGNGTDVLAVTSSAVTVSQALTVNANATVTGNTTLGDAAGDTLTINSTAVSIPNNLNFDSNTLFLDAANNRVGIGTATPAAPLEVSGSANNYTRIDETGAGAYNIAFLTNAFLKAGSISQAYDLNITSDEQVTFGPTATPRLVVNVNEPNGAGIVVNPQSATQVGAMIRGFASQTADLLQLQNSSGVAMLMVNPSGQLVFEGATDDAFETTFAVTDPTADRTITLPNETGTICLQSSASCGFATGTGSAYVQGGNNFGGTGTLGLTSNNDLNVITNSLTRLTVQADGDLAVDTNTLFVDATNNRVGIRNATPSIELEVNSSGSGMWLRSGTSATAGDTYNLGINTGTTDKFILQSDTGTRRQVLQFNDSGADDQTIFGIASSDDSGSTWNPRFVVQHGGEIGMGTNAPDARLHVAQAVDGDASLLLLQNSQANTAASTNETARLQFGFGGSNSNAAQLVAGKEGDYVGVNQRDSFLAFYTEVDDVPTERMRVTSAGFVGIGDTTPSGMLEIQGYQPASVATNGTAAAQALIVQGGKGGNTSGTTGQEGGYGGEVLITGGAGGDAPGGSENGVGGYIYLQGGAPGSGAGTAGTYGAVVLQNNGGHVGIGSIGDSGVKLTVADSATNTGGMYLVDALKTVDVDGGNIVQSPHFVSNSTYQGSVAASSTLRFPGGGGNISVYQSVFDYDLNGASANVNSEVNGYKTILDLQGSGGGTLDAYNGFKLEAPVVGTSNTISILSGVLIENATGAGTITDQYGITINALTKGTDNAGLVIGEATGTNQANLVLGQTTIPSGSYSIYNSSTDQNYFAGNLGIGDSTPDAMLDVAGSFQFDGNGVFGDASTDTVTFNAEVASHIIPDVDDTYDLGSSGNRWRDLYLGPASVHIGTAGDEGTISYNTTTNTFQFDQAVSVGGASVTFSNFNCTTFANGGKLTTNASGVLQCADDQSGSGGVTTIGTIDSQTKSANGAVITGNSLVLQTADVTFPGLVNTGSQTFAGAKTFNAQVTAAAAGTGLSVTNNASIGGNLSVTGNGTFTGDVAVNGGDLTSSGALNITPSGTLTLGVTGQAAILQGSNTTITSNGAGSDITLTSADEIVINSTGATVINEPGVAVNFRVESDTNANMLFVDGTNNRVGIGNAAPGAALEVTGDVYLTKEANRTIKIANTTTSGVVGGALTVAGGDGLDAYGGAVTIKGGAGTGTGIQVGGAVNILGGDSVGFVTGSDVNITAGSGIVGGQIKLNGGQGFGSSGHILLQTTDTNGSVGIGVTGPDARLELGGNKTQNAWDLNGIQLQASSATYTDNNTAASGTATNAVINSFGTPTLAATNTGVTTTNAATVYIQNAPAAGTNQTITNAYALWVDDGNVRFDGTVLSGAGTAALPTYSFSGDPNTGIYNIGADQLGISTGGTLRLTVSTSAITPTLPIRGQNGTAAAPALSFSGDTNTGLYSVGADQLGISTNGTLRVTVSTTGVTSTLPILGQSGSAAAPAYSFSGDTNTGVYSAGVDQLGFSTGGSNTMTIGSGSVAIGDTPDSGFDLIVADVASNVEGSRNLFVDKQLDVTTTVTAPEFGINSTFFHGTISSGATLSPGDGTLIGVNNSWFDYTFGGGGANINATVQGYRADLVLSGTGQVDAYAGFAVNTPQVTTTTLDTFYGLYIAPIGAEATTGWGIFQEGTGDENYFGGTIELETLGSAVGAETDICRDNTTNILRACTSLGQHKSNVQDLDVGGLDTINQLQARQFNWNGSGEADLGFIAEEVAAVNPLLGQHDAQGNLTGVKYRQMSALLVQGIQELDVKVDDNRAQITAVQEANTVQNTDILNLTEQSDTLSGQVAGLQTRQDDMQTQLSSVQNQLNSGQFSSLNVSGPSTFSNLTVTGTATINNLVVTRATVTDSLTINGHIITGNKTGTTTATEGLASCDGTVTVEGNDTAGTITIQTGAGSCAPGVLATVNFATSFEASPRVILTPANAGSAAVGYYTGATNNTSFTIDAANNPIASTTYIYNYHVLQ